MANLLLFCLDWIALLACTIYLLANVEKIDKSTGHLFLLFSYMFVSLSVLVRCFTTSTIYIRKSAFYLAAFLAYFVIKLFVDLGDLGEIHAATIGTSGGAIFGLIFGIMVSYLFGDIYARMIKNKQMVTNGIFIAVVYLTASTIMTLRVLMEHLETIRKDLFLIVNDSSMYQRPGDFIAINFSIISVVLIISCVLLWNHGINAGYRRFSIWICLIAYSSTAILSAGLAQLIGSNKGLLFVALVFVLTCSYLLVFNKVQHEESLLKGGKQLFPIFICCLLLFSSGLWILLWYLDIDTAIFRAGGFGDDSGIINRSLVSRIDMIVNNFLTHLEYNPFFGNMLVDSFTTGKGTYIHSLFSVATHLGIFGFILFLTYVCRAFKEIAQFKSKTELFYFEKAICFYRYFFVIVVGSVAFVGTFFTWVPLWFTVGFMVPPITIDQGYRRDELPVSGRTAERTFSIL